jgi:hypothetical protein
MLAGVRNFACGAAIAMAGLLVVIAANTVWIALFRLERVTLFLPMIPPASEYADPWASTVMWSRTDSLIGIAAVIWLIGRMVRHRRGGRPHRRQDV